MSIDVNLCINYSFLHSFVYICMLPCVGAEADSWKRAIDQAMHGRSITSNGGKELL